MIATTPSACLGLLFTTLEQECPVNSRAAQLLAALYRQHTIYLAGSPSKTKASVSVREYVQTSPTLTVDWPREHRHAEVCCVIDLQSQTFAADLSRSSQALS